MMHPSFDTVPKRRKRARVVVEDALQAFNDLFYTGAVPEVGGGGRWLGEG